MESMEPQKPQQYSAVVAQKKQLTKTVYHFVFHLDHPSELQFLPGQYATFIIDSTTRRQYSFCSDPHQSGQFEIVVDVSPMGPGSKFFISKVVGERVSFLAPLGNFHLEETQVKKVLVATGTGIAPYRSMILSGISNKDQNSSHPPISLYWGLRYEDDIYWDSEIEDLRGQLAGFQYFLCLSKPSENWKGLKGHVTEHVMENEKNLQNSEFYLCGNKAMIEELMVKLSAQNVQKEQIKSDLFY